MAKPLNLTAADIPEDVKPGGMELVATTSLDFPEAWGQRVYALPSLPDDPLVPVDEDILLDCGRWMVGRLVQYGRYVGERGVLNPVAWARLPKRGGA